MNHILIIFSLFQYILNDITIIVTPFNTQINTLTYYDFILSPTNTTIPQGTNILISFPMMYNTPITNPICSSVYLIYY